MATFSKCRTCGEVKEVEEFHRLRIDKGRRIYNPDCKSCVNLGLGISPNIEAAEAKGLPDKVKVCGRCGEEKSGALFGYRMMDGDVYLKSHCMECAADTTRRYRRNPAVGLVSGARARAKKRGILCTINVSDIHIPNKCPVFGIPLFVEGGKRTDNSPTLDRVDPEGGYTPDNIRVISWKANRLKSNMTREELTALYKYVNQCDFG